MDQRKNTPVDIESGQIARHSDGMALGDVELPEGGKAHGKKIAAFLVLFVASFFLQAVLSSGHLFTGVIAQFQVLISVVLVTIIPRVGYFVALAANAAVLLVLFGRFIFFG